MFLSLHITSHHYCACISKPYVLYCHPLGTRGNFSHWIVILQEYDLKFSNTTSKKSMVFVELMCGLPCALMEVEPNDSFLDEFLFLISMTDTWYGYLIIYLQTQIFHLNLSHDNHPHIRHHTKYYLIINDTLYQCGIDSILRRLLDFYHLSAMILGSYLRE